MQFYELEPNRPFYVANYFKNGNLKDWTICKKGEHGILIWFRIEKFWINPPTDTAMEYRIITKIEKYGVKYLSQKEIEEYAIQH